MKIIGKGLSLLLAVLMAFSLLPGAAFAQGSPWYAQAMEWAETKALVIEDAVPTSPVTRSQAIDLVQNAVELDADVLLWPQKEDAPSQALVTRAQMAALLYRCVQQLGGGLVPGDAPALNFSDADAVPEEAAEAFAYLTERHIVNGIAGTLAPQKVCTLAEAVAMVYRYAGDRSVLCTVGGISRHGNVYLDLSPDALGDAGFEPGDRVTVTVGDAEYTMPVGTGYSDVNPGEMVLVVKGDEISLCVNLRSFAGQTGLDEASVGTPVTISMAGKAACLRQYQARKLIYTDAREDYASDEIFCNFRPVNMGRLGTNILYRAASAVDNGRGRAALCDALYARAGIRTVVNLSDSGEGIESMLAAEGFASPYYKSLYEAGNVITSGTLGVDFTAESFRHMLADDLRAMSAHEGPYLIHCLEGKDRTGFAVMLLEALMGASYEEMLDDYMLSFVNYYHLEKDSSQYTALLQSNARYLFRTFAGLEDASLPAEADYEQAAVQYLTDSGMTETEIAALRACLAGDR